LRKRLVFCTASEPSGPSTASGEDDYIEVRLDKPLGLRFARGNDSGAYVIVNDPRLGNTDERIQVGDKIEKVSATFGTDIWDAKNFGQTLYAIRTRNGKVYLKLKRMFGDVSALQDEEMSEDEKMWKREQAGGNVGFGTRQIQERNYLSRKKREEERQELFELALSKFKKGDIESALIDFENVIATEATKYMGDNFARVSEVGKVAQYNAACCYSMLNQLDAGLEALETALKQGFDDYRKVRTDPNLDNLRSSESFTKLINQFDEPILNENAMKVIRGIFSFGKNTD